MFSKYLLVILTFILFFNITLLFYMILNKVWCIAILQITAIIRVFKTCPLYQLKFLVLSYNTVKRVISTPIYRLSAFIFAYTVKNIILKIAEIPTLMIFLTFMHFITKTTHLMLSFLRYLLLFHIYKKEDVYIHFLCYGFLWISLSNNNMIKFINIINKLTYLFFVSKIKRIIAQDLNHWFIKVFLDFFLVSLSYCLGFSFFYLIHATLSSRSFIKVSFHTIFYQPKLSII